MRTPSTLLKSAVITTSILMAGWGSVMAQTAWPGANNRSAGQPQCDVNTNVTTIGPGDYIQFNAVNTAQYFFNNCATANWDTDLRIYRTDNAAQLVYTDAGVGGCSASCASGAGVCNNQVRNFNWTSNYSGAVRVIQNRFGNIASPYGWRSNINSATLTYRQVKNFTNNTSNATICVGGTKSLTRTGNGTGGTWSIQSGGGSLSGTTYTGTSAGAKTIRYTLGSCFEDVSFSVVAAPDLSAPTFTNSAICAGGSTQVTSNLTGGTGTQEPVWQYFNGSTWVNVSNGTPTGATYTNATTATLTISGISVANNYQYRRFLNTTGLGCSANSGGATLSVVNDPILSGATIANSSICVGGSTAVTSTISGGTGVQQPVWQVNPNGGGWVNVVNGVPAGAVYTNSEAGTMTIEGVTATGTHQFRRVLNNTSLGCNAQSNAVTLTVTIQPAAAAIQRVPNTSPVCAGTDLTVSISGSSSGGAGTCADQFRYSINGGPFTDWTAGPPPTVSTASITSAPGTVVVQTRRNCSGGGCNSNINQVQWDVNPVPNAVATPTSQAFCSGGTASIALSTSPSLTSVSFGYTVSGGPNIFGQFSSSGNNISQVLFNEDGTTSETVTYTITPTRAGCSGAPLNVPVTVHPIPVAIATPSSQNVCNGQTTSINLTAAVTGTNFNWTVSGPTAAGGFTNAAGNQINQTLTNSSNANVGVTYTVTPSTANCLGDAIIVQVTVNPTPAVTFNSFGGPYCISDNTPISLIPFGIPASGTFSGPGVSNNDFVPSLAAVGTNTITYTYSDINGCPNTATTTVQVTGLPLVSFSGLSTSGYCVNNSSPISLTGFPAAPGSGVFTGPGISGNAFTPSVAGVGLHAITYTYTDANGCVGSQTQSVNVFALPNLGIFDLASSYCVDDAAVTASGFPPGGTFSGPGITGAGVFTPATATIGGPYTITYQFTDGNGCTNTTTTTTVVHPLPTVSFSGLDADYCIDAASETLVGSPAGGTFTGPGMTTGGVFTPSVAGLGTHSITYTFTNANGCTDFQTQTVEVTGIPGVTFTGLAADYCIDASPVTLSGNNAPDGNFSGPGITDNGNGTATFNPGTAGVGGPYNITYSYSNPLGCGFAETQQVVVNPLPDLSFTGLSAAYCVDAPTVTLAGSFAPGGSFTGDGITDNGNGTANFNPSAAGTGPASVTYAYTNSNGCSNTNTQGTTVNGLPTVSYTGAGEICIDQPGQPMVGTPSGGTFSGAGVSGNQFFPTIAGLGSFPVTYTFVDGNGCDDTFTDNFVVHNIPVVTVNPASVQVCPGDAVTFLVSANGTDLSYQWQVNNGSGFVDLNNGGIYSGVTTTSLNVGPISQPLNGFQYRARITGSTCSTVVFSNPASINISTSPEITEQPVTQFACVGDDTQFSVTALGSGLSYQWQVNTGSGWGNVTNGGPYSGATTPTLNVSNFDMSLDGNQYRVIVSGSSNCTSSTTSAVATLNGSTSPAITQQPVSQSVCGGATVTFAVTASGSGVDHQWQVNSGSGWSNLSNGGIYSGVTTPTLTLTGVTGAVDGYQYRVLVSSPNCAGTNTSDGVALNITTSPNIAQQPVNVQVCPNDNATFTVTADGTGNIYQWQRNTGSGFTNIANGGAFSGATTNTLSISSVTAGMDNHQFRVIVQHPTCSSATTSAIATLDISSTPSIATQPTNQFYCDGDVVTFSATASGSSLTYQWQRNTGSGWVNVNNNATYSGVTTPNLTVGGTTTAMDGHRFRLNVAGSVNCSGSTLSAVVELINTVNPVIITQPNSESVCENSAVSFTVTAGGSVTYQWQLDSGTGWGNITDGGIYSGATTATLNLSAVDASDDGNQYRVIISAANCVGTTTSQIATLTISDEPVISSQSPDQYVCSGDDAVFAVSVSGSGITYQWQEDDGLGFVDIVDGGMYAGANTAVLTISGVTSAVSGNGYRVIVSSVNCSGSSTSATSLLIENDAPVVLNNPANAQVCPGDNAVFSVSAGGSGLTYQWQLNSGSGFANISGNTTYSGTTSASLLVQNANTGMNSNQYRVIVSGSINCAQTTTSAYGVLTVSPNPTITQEPVSFSYCDGDNGTLTAAANGGVNYQWQVNTGSGWTNLSNGGIYSGATTATLTLTGIPSANSGNQYRVIVSGGSNCAGSATSAAATITDSPEPFIAQQPTDQFVCPGDVATFTVISTATGITYQWQENDGNGYVDVVDGGIYSGANTAALSISDATGLDGYTYQSILSSANCPGTSTTVEVSINETTEPAILDQPDDVVVCPGDNFTLTVAAGGVGLTYQWQVNTGSGFANLSNSTIYSGATTATLSVNGALPGMDGDEYQVIISSANCPGSSTSAIATVSVFTSPVIVTQPLNDAVCSGQDASFTLSAIGPNLTYQWQVNDGSGFVNIFNNNTYSGATTTTLNISNAGFAMNGYTYRAIVTGSVNCPQTATTNVVTLSVTQQPVANAGSGGNSCNFDFTFSALPSAGVGTWSQVSGTGTSTFAGINSPTGTATATLEGTYVYQWEEVNGACSDASTVTVNFYDQPVADAGPDANECDLDHTFSATASFGTGTWTLVNGPGIPAFVDANNPTTDVTVSAYGTYTFRWTEVNGSCNHFDDVTVNFYQQPVANAGTGGNECDLNFTFNAQPSVGSGVWTSVGIGTATFNNASSNVSTVTVSQYGSYTFTWTETNGTCVSSDEVVVDFYQQPVANAGNGGSVCGLDFVFNATLTTGTGEWTQTSGPGTSAFGNAQSPNSTVNVSQVGTYVYTWTETTGVCVSSASVTVNYFHIPVANAGSGGNECDLDFILNAQPSEGIGTWTQTIGPGFVSYSPNANTPGATVQVSAYGTYEFTWTEVDGGICVSQDAVTVNFYQQPVANAGPDNTSCNLNFTMAAVASAGTGTWTQVSGPGTSVFANPNSPATVVTVDVYGEYVYQWEEIEGTCSDADQVTINYYEQPAANAGLDVAECDLDVQLAAIPSAGVGSWAAVAGPPTATVTFSSIGDPNATATVTEYGQYTFTWTEVSGTCSSSDNVIVNFFEQPVANAGIGGDECDLNFALGAIPSVGNGVWTFTGPGAASFNNAISNVATVTVNTYGTYTFTWTETNGVCVDSDAIVVNFYEQPTANAGDGGSVCSLDFTFNATLSTGSGAWTQTSGPGTSAFADATSPASTVTVSEVGAYVFTWTETNGVCVSSAAVTVNFFHQPVADAGLGGDECDLDFVLNAQPSEGIGTWTKTLGPGFVNFTPNANTPDATVQVNAYGTYEFTWTEVDGVCSSSDVILVNFYQQPVSNAGPDNTSCNLNFTMAAVASVGLGTWTQVSGPGTSVFANPNSPATGVTVDVYGEYVYQWEEIEGTCSDADQMTVNYYLQPLAEAGFGGFECDLDFQLSANPSVGIGTWTVTSAPATASVSFSDNGDPSAVVTVTDLGQYTFTWTEVNGTCSSSDNVIVTFEQQTNADAGQGGDECDLDFTFNGTASFGTGIWTYTGPGTAFFTDDNSATSSVSVSQYGSYVFTWTETFGTCITTDQVTVNFYQQPIANAGQGGNSCMLNYNFSGAMSTPNGTGTWTQVSGPGTATFSDAGLPTAVVTVDLHGTYSFQWEEVNGTCSDNATITVNFYPQPIANPGAGGSECDLDFDFDGALSTAGGVGIWTLTNGFGTATFSDATDPATSVSVSAYGTYQFTWTETNGTCTDAASVIINFYQQPVADAGLGDDVCTLTYQLQANPSVGVGQWTQASGPGASAFTNAASAFSSVTVSQAGTYVFTWTETTGSGTCSSSDDVTVSFFGQPAANAGQGGNECDFDFDLAALPNLGTGEWTQSSGPGTSTFINAISAITTVTVDQYGTYTYTWSETEGVCVSSDVITVNYYEQPVADAGQGGSECDLNFNLNATQSVGVSTGQWVQTSGPGFSSFSPNAGTGNAVVTVNTPGQYVYTWTETNGTCFDSGTVTVDYFQQPVANTGPVSNQCDLDITLAAIPSAGIGTWTVTGPGNGTFSDENAPNALLTVDQFGTYSLTWSEVNGTCSDAASVTVAFNDLPTVSFTGLAASYCIDQTALVLLTGTPSGGIFSGQGMTGANFIPSAAGAGTFDITYTYTDGNSCTSSQTQSVDVNPLPTPTFTGLGQAYCVSEQAPVTLTATPAGGTFAGPGINGSEFLAATAGAGTHTITYTYTDPLGCTGVTTQSVVVNPLPVVSFTGLASEYCEDVSLVTLTGTPAGGTFAGPGMSGNVFNPTQAGSGAHEVSYTYTDGNSCTNTATQNVNVNTLPAPVITPNGTIEICQGSFVVLNAGSGYFQYQWNNSESGQTLLVNQAGTYNVTVTSQAGCQALSADVQVVVNALPTVDLGPDQTVCTGGFVTLDAGNPGMSHAWMPTQEITQNITVGTAGTYSVTVTDANGCSATDAVSVSVSNVLTPTITANGSTTICQGQTLTLNAGSGYASYLWGNGSQNQFIDVTAGGTYEVNVSNVDGCAGSASINVTVNQLPNAVVTASGSTNLCPGASVTLTASNTFATYVWNLGNQTTPSINVTQAGSYTVTVTDPVNGCSATSQPVNVTQAQTVQPTIVANGPLEFCQGGSVVLSVSPTGAFNSFLWTTGSTTPSITVNSSSEVGVSVLDANNCLIETLLANPTVITVWNPQPQVQQQGGTLFVTNGPFQFYQWFRNGQPVPGATQDSYSPTQSGNFVVQVTDVNDCSGTSSNTEFTFGVSIEDVRDVYDLKVYPNPNNGLFVLEAELGNHTDVTLIVRDMLGRDLMPSERIQGTSSFRRSFDLGHLANGMYFVQVMGRDGVTVKQVIKQ